LTITKGRETPADKVHVFRHDKPEKCAQAA
jgi:hypothetical protein